MSSKKTDLEIRFAHLKAENETLKRRLQEAEMTPRQRRASANRKLQEGASRDDPRETYLRRRNKLEDDGGEAA